MAIILWDVLFIFLHSFQGVYLGQNEKFLLILLYGDDATGGVVCWTVHVPGDNVLIQLI